MSVITNDFINKFWSQENFTLTKYAQIFGQNIASEKEKNMIKML